MAKILFTWELGLGLGHLSIIEPLAAELARRGHEMFLAVREHDHVGRFACGVPMSVRPAPVKQLENHPKYEPIRTFAHLLHNAALGNTEDLAARVAQWRMMFAEIRPDLVVFDHSPTALLAARDQSFRRIVMGMGFCCPPPITPFPDWRPHLPIAPGQLAREEQAVHAQMNEVLGQYALPTLGQVSDLYSQTDGDLLYSVTELDPYPSRPPSRWWGQLQGTVGAEPTWSAGHGPQVFVYLKPSPTVPAVLQQLADWNARVLIYSGQNTETWSKHFRRYPTLRFEAEPVNIQSLAKTCDFAVVNATHVTTLAILLAGKPVLCLPIVLESMLTAQLVQKLGAGFIASALDPNGIAAPLTALVSGEQCAVAAQQFAAKYRHLDPDQQRTAAVDYLESQCIM